MRSFRTSPWDTYENLPRDYARIFQFEDFKRTERGVRRRAQDDLHVVEVSSLHASYLHITDLYIFMQPGVRVTVHLQDVPAEVANIPHVVLFSLLQHEHKITVLNFTVQRNTEYDGSVRSKVSNTCLDSLQRL